MQILFDTDCLIQALENLENSAVLDLCRRERCKGWVLSTSVPALLAGRERERFNRFCEAWLF